MTHSVRRWDVRGLRVAVAACALAAGGCERGGSGGSGGSGGQAAVVAEASAPRASALVDAGPPADRLAVRRVVTFYRWSSTEPGNESTHGESIEHGTP